MGELVAEFPEAQLSRGGLTGGLHDPVFGLAEQIEAALDEEVEGKRQAGGAIGEDAVVDVAAGGEVAGQGRGLLPHLAAAAGVLVVAVGEGLAGDEPEALEREKGREVTAAMRWGRLNRKRRRRANRWVITIESARLSLNGGDGGDERRMMRGRSEVRAVVCLAKTSP